MGSEWERKRAAGYRKLLDKSLLELSTPDLFTRTPTRGSRVVVADIAPGASIKERQELVVQRIGERFALLSGLDEIGELSSPHADVIDALARSCGVAKGLIETFHEDALVAEIALC